MTNELKALLAEIVDVSVRFKKMTNKPLGTTGEVGEHIAQELLGVTLKTARHAGYDAIDETGKKIQIKTRLIQHAREKSGKIGIIRLDKVWDSVMLVLLMGDYEPVAIYEASREQLLYECSIGNSQSKKNGALSISQFIAASSRCWPKAE